MLHRSADRSPALTGDLASGLRWGILLVLLPFFAHNDDLVQTHYLQKVWVLVLVSAGMALVLALRSRLRLPPRGVMWGIAAWLVLSVLSGMLAVSPMLSYLNTAVVLSAFVLFLFLLNVRPQTVRMLMAGVVVAGLLQFLTLVEWMPGLPTDYVSFDPTGRWIGTVGNSEFLATFLGCGVFGSLHFMRLTRIRWQKIALLAAIAILVLGLVLTRNKGALFLIGAYFLWRFWGRRPWPWILLGAASVGVAIVFPATTLGRLLLWITGLEIFASHPLIGVGPGQLCNHYIGAVQDIFARVPAAAGWFGAHTASVRDAHNLFVSFGLELGIGGFALAGVFLWFAFRMCRPLSHPLRGGLVFLLIKSLYTVVISSGSGAILLSLFLAATLPRRWLRRVALPAGARAVPLLGSVLAIALTHAWVDSERHLNRGTRLAVLGEKKSARSEMREALKANPEHPEAWLTLGLVEFLDHDRAAMGSALDQAVYFLRDMDTYKKSAHMYFFVGDYQKALPLYSKLLVAYPQHLTSMARLAQIYEAMGDRAGARDMARRLLDTAPRVPSASDLRNTDIARRLLAD